jgi:hypothetical protein
MRVDLASTEKYWRSKMKYKRLQKLYCRPLNFTINGAYLSSLALFFMHLPLLSFYPSCRKSQIGKKMNQMLLNYSQAFSSIIQRLLGIKSPPKERVIKAHFGLNLAMLSRIYNIVSSHPHQNHTPISPLLVALHFLKLYAT